MSFEHWIWIPDSCGKCSKGFPGEWSSPALTSSTLNSVTIRRFDLISPCSVIVPYILLYLPFIPWRSSLREETSIKIAFSRPEATAFAPNISTRAPCFHEKKQSAAFLELSRRGEGLELSAIERPTPRRESNSIYNILFIKAVYMKCKIHVTNTTSTYFDLLNLPSSFSIHI